MEHYKKDLEEFEAKFNENYPKYTAIGIDKYFAKYKVKTNSSQSKTSFYNAMINNNKKFKEININEDDREKVKEYKQLKDEVEKIAKRISRYNGDFLKGVKTGEKLDKFKDKDDVLTFIDRELKDLENEDLKGQNDILKEDKEQLQLKYDDQEIKHDKDKRAQKETLETLTQQGSKALDKQNKENAKLWQALEELGLNQDEIKGMLEEVKTRYTDLKKESDKEVMNKKFSKALKNLIRDKANESDISTVPKESLKERLIKNHSDLIHNEKEAEAAADAIYRAALNKKVQYNKNSRYLYQFYEDFPQYVNLLPEEQQEVINKEIQRRYAQQQHQKILHYMLPKERPKWEKATVEHHINPQLGRRTYG